MSLDLVVVIVLAGAAVWYFLRNAAEQTVAKAPEPRHLEPTATDIESATVSDPFLDEVAQAKQQTDLQVEAITRDYERELENRFSGDVQLKERLSQFARQQELDQALIAIWKEVEHYPAWVEREDFSKWNKLELVEIGGSEDGKVKTVLFSYGGHRYAVSEKEWHGEEGDAYADFVLREDGAEVFAIGCSVQYDEYVDSYRCHSVNAFKKRGHWAKMLIELYRRIQINENKRSSELKYFNADKIKERFEE